MIGISGRQFCEQLDKLIKKEFPKNVLDALEIYDKNKDHFVLVPGVERSFIISKLGKKDGKVLVITKNGVYTVNGVCKHITEVDTSVLDAQFTSMTSEQADKFADAIENGNKDGDSTKIELPDPTLTDKTQQWSIWVRNLESKKIKEFTAELLSQKDSLHLYDRFPFKIVQKPSS